MLLPGDHGFLRQEPRRQQQREEREEQGGRPGHQDGVGGQRVATVVVYLADVEGGGETVFPGIGLSIRPRAGSAAYFEYFNQQGLVDSRCLHAGAPVSRGEKWIATKWLRHSDYRSPD